MRQNLWLLAAVLAIAGSFSLFVSPAGADDVASRGVYGYAYKGANVLANYPIERSTNGGQSWTYAATTDGNGRYEWIPLGIPDYTTINMRLQPHCIDSDVGADPTDTPTWVFNSQSIREWIQVDVHGSCP